MQKLVRSLPTWLRYSGDDGRALCMRLRQLGVAAELAREGIPFGEESLDLLTIDEGPIRWANVRVVRRQTSDAADIQDEDFTDYCVPDPRLRAGWAAGLAIECVKLPPARLFGQATAVRWQFHDFGLGLLRRLEGDRSLADPILRSPSFPRLGGYRPVLRIRSRRDGFWTITVPGHSISADRWRCYQAIARHLLATPPSSRAGGANDPHGTSD